MDIVFLDKKTEKNLLKFEVTLQLFLKDYTKFGKNSSAWREQFTVCFWYFAQRMILSVAQNQILKKRIRKQKKICCIHVFLLFFFCFVIFCY